MIASVGYDQGEKILEVEFVNNGLIYEYFDVPVTEYQNLMKASSKGSYLQKCIANCYGYGRVSPSKRSSVAQDFNKRIDLQYFSGVYAICELLDADGRHLDTEGAAFLRIAPDGRGTFRIEPIRGLLQGKVMHHHGEMAYQFRWQGKDDNGGVSGNGWLVLGPTEEAEGEISLGNGSNCFFRAHKVERE